MKRAGARAPVDPSAWLDAAASGETDLDGLREAAAGCRACPLWRRATQTVFGEGPARASVVLVGEQPGDREDLEGRPFVGPAGRLLERALEESGLAAEPLYVTNAVKHFKWQERGKRRIHAKPTPNEVRACRPWLQAELAALEPRAIVCLGATAAQSLLGRDVRVTRDRGRFLPSPLAPLVTATVHPSSILRARGDAERADQRERFVEDLRRVARRMRGR